MQVSVACFGTMTFGWEPDDWGSHEEQSIALTQEAIDLGINFFDTADVYARGVSEKILGKALKGKREKVVLANQVPRQDGRRRPQRLGQQPEARDRGLRGFA